MRASCVPLKMYVVSFSDMDTKWCRGGRVGRGVGANLSEQFKDFSIKHVKRSLY